MLLIKTVKCWLDVVAQALIPELQRLRQEEFKAILNDIARPCLNEKQNTAKCCCFTSYFNLKLGMGNWAQGEGGVMCPQWPRREGNGI